MPADREAGQRALLDRLDLFAQTRERALPQRAQDAGVDPLGAVTTRTELAFDCRARRRQLPKRTEHQRWANADAPGEIGRGERAVGARVPAHERDQGTRIPDEERVGETLRDHDAQRVAVLRRVLGRDEARLERDRYANDAALLLEIREPLVDVRAADGARGDLVAPQIAEPQQQVVDCVGMLRDAVRREVLELQLELVERVSIEQLAQLGLTEELAQLQRIDRERLRAPLGQWRVALVDEVADICEQQRGRERRG